jgi:hypothetical protein
MLVGRRISADDTAVAAVRLPSFEPEVFFLLRSFAACVGPVHVNAAELI